MDKHDDTYGLNFTPPRNLIVAHSLIQQWYVAENHGQPFSKDFFTLEHTMQFAFVSIKSALFDSLIWLFIYVLGGAFVYFVQYVYFSEQYTQILFWTFEGSPLYWFTKVSSFMGLIFSSLLCVMMARYYTGTVAKKAVNTIFTVRALFLICFSIVAFFVLGLFYKYIGNPNTINQIVELFVTFKVSSDKIYYFVFYYLRRMLFESGIVLLCASTLSVLIPFLSIIIIRLFKKNKNDYGFNYYDTL